MIATHHSRVDLDSYDLLCLLKEQIRQVACAWANLQDGVSGLDSCLVHDSLDDIWVLEDVLSFALVKLDTCSRAVISMHKRCCVACDHRSRRKHKPAALFAEEPSDFFFFFTPPAGLNISVAVPTCRSNESRGRPGADINK